MTDIPHFLVEASADDEGVYVAVSRWGCVELDPDSDVPLMLGKLECAIEAAEKPDCDYQRFTSFTALARGEIALCKILNKVFVELASMEGSEVRQWIDKIMIFVDNLAASEQ